MVRQFLVYDALDTCPYLPDRLARFPLRVSERKLRRDELDTALAEGDRRQGVFLYRPSCPTCSACEAIRIDVERFTPTASLRRVMAKGDARLTVRIGPAVADEERAALYVRHKFERGLTADGETREVDVAAYRAFLVETCCDTVEFACRSKGDLVAVAVADRGSQALSAVYCAFAPDFGDVSLGTYCILKQIEACRAWGLRYLYLGLYVADCRHLAYKARFLPHERLIQGQWRQFDRPGRLPDAGLTFSPEGSESLVSTARAQGSRGRLGGSGARRCARCVTGKPSSVSIPTICRHPVDGPVELSEHRQRSVRGLTALPS